MRPPKSSCENKKNEFDKLEGKKSIKIAPYTRRCDKEILLNLLFSTLNICSTKEQYDTNKNKKSADTSENCQVIIDIFEKHGCEMKNRELNKLGTLIFPICNMREITRTSTYERTSTEKIKEKDYPYETGTKIKKSLKSMTVNNPELFGLIPTEMHTSIPSVPIIVCNCTNCHLSKFSLVESQVCKCKDTQNLLSPRKVTSKDDSCKFNMCPLQIQQGIKEIEANVVNLDPDPDTQRRKVECCKARCTKRDTELSPPPEEVAEEPKSEPAPPPAPAPQPEVVTRDVGSVSDDDVKNKCCACFRKKKKK